MIAGEADRGERVPAAAPARTAPQPAGRAVPVRPQGSTRTPAWLRAADSCLRSERRPLPMAVDLAFTAGSVYAVSGSGSAAASAAGLLVLGGLLVGVWKRRSSLQAQGVGWYLRRITPCVLVVAVALSVWPGLPARTAFLAGADLVVWLATTKIAFWVLVATARRRGLGLRRTLVIGPERQVGAIEYRIHLYPEAGLVCAHSVVCPPARRGRTEDPLALISALVGDHSIEHIICAGGDTGSDSVLRDVVRLAPLGIDVSVVQQVPLAGGGSYRLGDLGVLCLSRPSWGADTVKRAFDVIVASALLVLLSPLLAATALAIRLGDPGPALFLQRRTGRDNRLFTIFKFRSMVLDAERIKPELMSQNVADGLLFKAADDPRITRVGSCIRRFGIDELPQLINVVRGEMSLVGPRPLPHVFDPEDRCARARHSVLPGITGLWQVKGANALPYEDMIDLDCAYVTARSLGFDLKILLQTVPAVIVRRDPY